MMSEPNNTTLLELLNQYSQNNGEGYQKVVEELLNRTAYLLLPSDKPLGNEYKSWTYVNKSQTVELPVYIIEGMKTVPLFSNEKAFLSWKGRAAQYVAMPSSVLIELCESKGIEQIIIDSGSHTMFVLYPRKS